LRPIALDDPNIGPNNESPVPARAPAVAATLLAALCLASPGGALPASLGSRLARALHVPHVPFSASAAVALDLDTGRVVYAHNATLPLLPASNEKLAVTYAALTALGPAFRIETDVLGEGEQEGDVWHGDLVLKGYGDPTLSSRSLTLLARQIRGLGIAQVTGRVVADETWFDAHRTAPGWKASFYINESPPLSALIVDRGLVGMRTSRAPAAAAGRLFHRALARAGVRIAHATRLGAAGDDAVALAAVDSPTLEALVHWMDVYSDNFTAEMLVKELGAVQAGNGTTAAGLRVVGSQLAQAGVPLAGVRLADGSGLSRLDRMTASTLVSLLHVMWSDPELQPDVLASLPVAGRTGTLHDRMSGTAAAGVVRAKTGTTDDATALSGFVGGRYVFSVLVNGAPVSWAWSRTAEDRFVTTLASSR
jgi:D-alanyl-D-alanine carboxypeptidase/D-alanyl-D-alanine-endopeptidase (penicillin-binding protein 4)